MTPLQSALAAKLVAGLCAVLLLALLIHDRNRWKASATLRQEQVVAQKAAHSATIANYRAAAEQARAADLANLARVRAEQQAINERTANDYESRIAAARALGERLRGQAGAGAGTGAGRGAPVPGVSAASGGASEAAGEDRFSFADRLLATEQAIQLDELIKWVKAQAEVDSSGR